MSKVMIKTQSGEERILSTLSGHGPSLREAVRNTSISLKDFPLRNAAYWLAHKLLPN